MTRARILVACGLVLATLYLLGVIIHTARKQKLPPTVGSTVEKTDSRKTDREKIGSRAEEAPLPVKPITRPLAAVEPIVTIPPKEEDPPPPPKPPKPPKQEIEPAKIRRMGRVHAEDNICTRHHGWKVSTGRSWHCQYPRGNSRLHSRF